MSFVPQVICFFVMKDLIENKIGDGGACALSEALKTNTRLFHLGLIGLFTAKVVFGKLSMFFLFKTQSANNIGDKGAVALGEALKTNIALKIIHLAGIFLPFNG